MVFVIFCTFASGNTITIMKTGLSFLFGALISCIAVCAVSAQEVRTLHYHPEGRDIVCHDGQRRYTRALYGGYTDFRVETSDRPIFATYRKRSHRNIRFSLTTGGKTTPLGQLEERAACHHGPCAARQRVGHLAV